MIVYFDMDNVLTDYDGQLARVNNTSVQTIRTNQELRRLYETIRKQSLGAGHWRDLLPNRMHEFKSMIREITARGHTVEILTSYGPPIEDGDCGALALFGKQEWLKTHYNDMLSGYIERVNGVARCWQKCFYATPESVLIDDQLENVEQFRARGGKAFHYVIDRHEELRAYLASLEVL